LGSSYTVDLSEKHSRTNIPVSASELANAYILQSKRRGADIVVDERFRLVLELRPLLNGKDWEVLPEDEAARLDDGDSILLDRAKMAFRVQFEMRGGRIIW
jgi:hypothetical protein